MALLIEGKYGNAVFEIAIIGLLPFVTSSIFMHKLKPNPSANLYPLVKLSVVVV